MRIAIAGATGRIGLLTQEALVRDGHEVVPISRRCGVDLLTGGGSPASGRRTSRPHTRAPELTDRPRPSFDGIAADP